MLFLLFIWRSYSQSYVYKHYTTEDGIPHDITYGIIQDSNGFIWFGTDDGLTKFDGKKIKNYGYEDGLTSNFVVDIIEYKKNEYAIATWGGGLFYLKKDSIFKVKNIKDNYAKLDALGFLKNDLIYASPNTNSFLLYGNKKREFWINGNAENFIKPYSIDGEIDFHFRMFQSVVKGDLFIHAPIKISSKTNKDELKGIYLFEEDKIHQVFDFLKDTHIYTYYSDGNLNFFGSTNTIYIGDSDVIKEVVSFPGMPSTKIISIKKHRHFLYFIANYYKDSNRVLYKYNLKTEELICLSSKLGIDKMISDFLIDNQNNLWVTTYGNGVYCVSETKNVFLGKETFFNPDLKDALFIKDKLYMLSTNVIYQLDEGEIISSKKFPFHAESFVYNKSKNSLNILKDYDKFKNKNDFDVAINVVDASIYSFELGSYNIKVENEYLYVYRKSGLIKMIKHDSTIKKVYIRGASLYVLSHNKNLQIYSLETGLLIKEYNKNNGLTTQKINDFLVLGDDEVLLGTNGGFFKIKGNEVCHFTKEDGLESNHINSLVIDDFGVFLDRDTKGFKCNAE